jgi:hypothetical protein
MTDILSGESNLRISLLNAGLFAACGSYDLKDLHQKQALELILWSLTQTKLYTLVYSTPELIPLAKQVASGGDKLSPAMRIRTTKNASTHVSYTI